MQLEYSQKRKGGETSSKAGFTRRRVQALIPATSFNGSQINSVSRSACLKYSPYLIEKDVGFLADLRQQWNNKTVGKQLAQIFFPFNSDFK